MEHREVTLTPGRGEIAVHHVDQIELIEGHARHKGDRIGLVLPLVHKLLIGIAICEKEREREGKRSVWQRDVREGSTYSCL